MQLACDARTFAHACFELKLKLLRDLKHAVSIEKPCEQEPRRDIGSSEPPSIPPRRKYRDLQCGSRLAPLAAIRSTLHPKMKRAGGKAGVGHCSSVTPDFRPRTIHTLECVTITICLRVGICEC